MPESLIDLTTYNELRQNTDAEFVAELVDTYCAETPQLIDQLRHALAAGDTEGFRRAAHSIKSSRRPLSLIPQKQPSVPLRTIPQVLGTS